MFAHVKTLWWWKQVEHNSESCEDAYRYDIKKGLFAVADGMGTMVFSRLWANILVERFVKTTPLIGNDPFETAWWLHPTQLIYTDTSPKIEALDARVRSKAREGSASTLATLRIISSTDGKGAVAELLAFGDSCIFVGNVHDQQMRLAFPLSKPSDFDHAPIGLPSLPWKYNRHFHLAHARLEPLRPGDVIILATDAVSKWIISKGADTCTSVWEAFQRITTLQPDDLKGTLPGPEGTWSHFIQQCRDARPSQMVNDDVTALIITLSQDGEEDERLGSTLAYPPSIIQQRRKDFQEAVNGDLKDLIAINYGDGNNVKEVPYPHIEKARQVADALATVWQVFRREINSPDLAGRMKQTLTTYGPLLADEPCAADLKNTLKQFDILLVPPKETLAVVSPPPKSLPAKVSLPSTPPVPTPIPEKNAPPTPPQPVKEQEKTPSIVGQGVSSSADSNVHAGSQREEQERKKKEAERRKIELIRNFYKALYSGNVNDLHYVEQAMHQSAYPELQDILEVEREHIQGVYDKKQTLERLREVLRLGTAREKKDAYQKVRDAGYGNLPPDVELQAQLATKFLYAYQQSDDTTFLTIYDEIQQSRFGTRFKPTKDELHRINHARQNKDALEHFRTIIANEGITARKVVEAHQELHAANPALEQQLSPDERYLIMLAEYYTQAYANGVDGDLVDAYDKIYYSSFKFSFQDEERLHVEQARKRGKILYHSSIIVTVNDEYITLHEYESLYVGIKIFLEDISWWLHVLAAGKHSKGYQPLLQIIPAIDRCIILLRTSFTHPTILAMIVDDLILQKSEVGVQIADEINTQSAYAARQIFKVYSDRQNIVIYYEEILKKVMAIFIRYAFVDNRLRQQQENIEQWLSDQKLTMRISYPEYAMIDQSGKNADPARSWLLKWPLLNEDIKLEWPLLNEDIKWYSNLSE